MRSSTQNAKESMKLGPGLMKLKLEVRRVGVFQFHFDDMYITPLIVF